ncbi:MAG: M16 family metallopeptidase [Candidatus Saccharimonadia bacterium]
MKYERTQLPNGLRIISVHLRDAQSIAVSVLAGVGSRHENFPVNGGVSHFLEHLLFKGTRKRPSTKLIAEIVDGVGGLHNAYTSNDLTNYYIKVPKQHAALAIDILADMIREPLLDPVEVDRERGVVIEEMSMYNDDPSRFVHELLPPLLWPDDPLGKSILGSEEVIKSISRDAIADYQKLHYSPTNLVVSVAGDITHEKVVELVTKLMGDMEPYEVPMLKELDDRISPRLSDVLKKDTNQAHLLIGCKAYPYNGKLDPAARVLTNLLGAGLSSRLFINVRERQGLAYNIYADYNNYVDTGQFNVYAGVNLDKIDQATESILKELRELTEELVPPAELEKVKNKMSGSLQMALENTFAMADRIGTRLLLLNQIKTPDQTLAEIAEVTAEDVLTAAKELFEVDRLRLAIIAPDPQPVVNTFQKLVSKGKKVHEIRS